MHSAWTRSGLLPHRHGVKTPWNLFARRRVTVTEATIDMKFDLYRLEKGPPLKARLTVDDATYVLKMMNRTRRIEHKAAELYRQKLSNGLRHLYVGQEAMAVGTKMGMSKVDTLVTSYRCHGFALVFDASIRNVLVELMERKTGVSKDKSGSMRVYAPQFYGGEDIASGQATIGTGIALVHKYMDTGGVSIAMYGDGAASQGQLYEAWNMAKLWNLPVVYICENNKHDMGTPVHRHSANSQFYTRGDIIPGMKVDGTRVMDVREAIRFARNYAFRNGPIVIEAVTYRFFGHMPDPVITYRSRKEIKTMQTNQDPIKLFSKLVTQNGLMTEQDVRALREESYKKVDTEVEQATKNSKWPDKIDVGTEVYAKPLKRIGDKSPWEILNASKS